MRQPAHAATGRGGSGRRRGGASGPVTIEDVAARAGVSAATVSRTLNGNYPVAATTRTRVERAVRDLGYVVNAHARALAGSTTRTVGIVVNDVIDPFFAYIARGVEREATARGRMCLIAATQGDSRRELAIVDLLHEQRADAVVLVGGAVADPAYTKQMAARAKALAAGGSVLVLCGRPSLGPGVPTAQVGYDNEGGAAAITEYLIAAGHRRILYLGGPAELSTSRARLAGHRKALRARRIPSDPKLIQTGAFGRRFGYHRMQELLAAGPDFTAVFAANDVVAAGAMQALHEAARTVPDDISIVGYDDVPVAAEVRPGLTTVHVPLEEMGREAVRLALAGEDTDTNAPPTQAVTVGTHIVARESVAAPSKGARRQR
ncbi:LacI family DNA-binding transcriptional regulator [Actinocatenispora rupis]|uniref:LacI family transcriptional regulator n=1 Tax=Actinocatenispora rupis TaxID=519421 RepID=A0A8J3NBE1_9ACTN|nr:LacI family DNA-binding transcriptional regulator [Actinocatenispora rupis]GID10567.1 LacI family transcriptional regulator [Actinocatenispora rupis]